VLILEDLSAEVPDTNAFHWHLKDFSDDDGENVLMYGYNSATNENIHKKCSSYKRKAFFNNWSPCEFSQREAHPGLDALEYDNKFDIVYSICPFTNQWLNNKGLGREYRTMFYPFSEHLIPQECEKQYDVIYHGGIHGREHVDCLDAMMYYNYRYCTMTHHINELTARHVPYATNVNLQFQEKIDLIAKTKISICYNLVHIFPEHVGVIKSYDGWEKNAAFREVDKQRIKPQFKTRMHEAAISKTLNLVHRDRWNVVEDYYEPDKEFIYFDDSIDLREKIHDIVNDWENYSGVVENAFEKAKKYTVKNFVNFIKDDIKK